MEAHPTRECDVPAPSLTDSGVLQCVLRSTQQQPRPRHSRAPHLLTWMYRMLLLSSVQL